MIGALRVKIILVPDLYVFLSMKLKWAGVEGGGGGGVDCCCIYWCAFSGAFRIC